MFTKPGRAQGYNSANNNRFLNRFLNVFVDF